MVKEQLRESEGANGAFFCDYDFFKVIYHAEARAIARSGDAVHICLLSVTGQNGQELPKRSLDRCMENLREIIRSSLRRGDVAARCSVSQYILMLPQANYENSRMVCQRIIKAFCRQYPHSPARLYDSVQPLEPNMVKKPVPPKGGTGFFGRETVRPLWSAFLPRRPFPAENASRRLIDLPSLLSSVNGPDDQQCGQHQQNSGRQCHKRVGDKARDDVAHKADRSGGGRVGQLCRNMLHMVALGAGRRP